MQVLQAANTGITSLQKLVDTAKSIANQALQTTVGYSTKSNVVRHDHRRDRDRPARHHDLHQRHRASATCCISGAAGGTTAATAGSTLGGTCRLRWSALRPPTRPALPTSLPSALTLTGAARHRPSRPTASPADGDASTVNGKTITFKAGSAPLAAAAPAGSGVNGNIVTDGNGNSTVYLGTTGTPTATVGDLLNAIDLASGVRRPSTPPALRRSPTSAGTDAADRGRRSHAQDRSTGADLSITGKADLLKALGLTASLGPATSRSPRRARSPLRLARQPDPGRLDPERQRQDHHVQERRDSAGCERPDRLGVSGNLVTDGNGNSTVYLQGATIADTLKAIDLATGVQTATIVSGAATVAVAAGRRRPRSIERRAEDLSTGTTADLAITGTGNALSALGLTGNTGTGTSFTAGRTAAAGGLDGKTLTFTSFNGGTAVNVTFGDGTGGTVKTLDQLNAALLANNLTATVDSTGKLTITTTNDYASSTRLGAIRRRDRRHAHRRAHVHDRVGSGGRCIGAG